MMCRVFTEVGTDAYRTELENVCKELQRMTRTGELNKQITKVFSFPGETDITLSPSNTQVVTLKMRAADNTQCYGIGVIWHVMCLDLQNPWFYPRFESQVHDRTRAMYNNLVSEMLPFVYHGDGIEYIGR